MALTERRLAPFVEEWLTPVLDRIRAGLPVVFKCAGTSSDSSLSRALAEGLVEAVCGMVAQPSGLRGLPSRLSRVPRAKIHRGYATRDMLPHHDAHHTSYLAVTACAMLLIGILPGASFRNPLRCRHAR